MSGFLDANLRVPAQGWLENLTLQDSAARPDVCGSGHFVIDGASGRFNFSESATETGCGELGFWFEIPPGARRLELVFWASRSIGQTSAAALPVDARQAVRLYDENGRLVESFSYFDSATGSRPSSPFTVRFDAPSASSRVNISWYFEDHGYRGGFEPIPSPGTSQAFSSTVTTPAVRIADYPLSAGRLVEARETRDGPLVRNESVVSFDVPPLLRTAADTMNVTLSLYPEANVTGLVSPRGAPVLLSEAEVRISASGKSIILRSEVWRQHGFGQYGVVATTTQLVAAALPQGPATVYPFVFTLIAVPIFPGILAVRSALLFRREAKGRYVGDARALVTATAVTWLVYVGLVVFVGATGRIPRLATLPLRFEDWAFDFLFLALALVFVVLWVYPSRFLLRSMRADLAERDRMELELTRSNQELESFAYVASHDLQEPLRTVSGFAQLLQRRHGGRLPPEAVHYIDRTVEGSQRLQRLINDLLEYSRVQTRAKAFEPADLNDVFDKARGDLDKLIRESKARVARDNLPTVRCDALQLGQVFANLLRNAMNYCDPKRRPRVRASARPSGDIWEFTVEDNGVGIDPQYHDRIFGIFQRLEPEGKAHQGTGLGLAIVKKIVERHGGRVWVDSAVGQGSAFHFTIPTEAGQSPAG